jgi:hypothetical protein
MKWYAQVRMDAYRTLFMSLYSRSRVAYEAVSGAPALGAHCLRNWADASGPRQTLPVIAVTLADLATRLQAAYQLTTGGNFVDAIERFRQLLLAIPLLVVDNKQEIAEAQQLIEICREYLVGLLMETQRKDMAKETIEEQVRVKTPWLSDLMYCHIGAFLRDGRLLHSLSTATSAHNADTAHCCHAHIQVEKHEDVCVVGTAGTQA